MKKILITVLILLASCQSKMDERTALLTKRSDGLIASAEGDVIPIKYIDTPLTQEDCKRLDRQYPITLEKVYKTERLQIQDIIHLTRAGVADTVIIEIIDSSHSLFYLSSEDKKELEQAGVSKRVFRAMDATTDTKY